MKKGLNRLSSSAKLWTRVESGWRRALKRWVTKGLWAVLDQGFFASSNFVLNVLLARWLAPADYGAFSLAFAVFLLIGSLHTAVLTEPMLVFGPGKYKDRLSEYMARSCTVTSVSRSWEASCCCWS